MLKAIGLAHVALHILPGDDEKAGGAAPRAPSASEVLLGLYEAAPPVGVTLVLTSTFTDAWPFAHAHPQLFREKTVRVVHRYGGRASTAVGWAACVLGIMKMEDNLVPRLVLVGPLLAAAPFIFI